MKNAIIDLQYDNIKTNKFYKNENFETIVVSIEKGKTLQEHTSHLDVCLIMFEGEINFFINNETINLKAKQSFSFQKNVLHEVFAIENSKFLLIR